MDSWSDRIADAGKLRRARRLCHLPSGRMAILPLDGALPLGRVDGGDDLAPLVRMAHRARADAVLLRWGEARRLAGELHPEVGLIIRLSGATSVGPDPTYEVPMHRVDSCARLGADAVCATLYLGSPRESASLRDIGHLAEQAAEAGLLLLCEAFALGADGEVDLSPERIGWSARILQELGADLVKIPYPGSAAAVGKVTARCQVPLVVAGGAVTGPEEVLRAAAAVIEGGGAGVAVMRHDLAHRDPAALQAALADLVHGDCSLEQALALVGSDASSDGARIRG